MDSHNLLTGGTEVLSDLGCDTARWRVHHSAGGDRPLDELGVAQCGWLAHLGISDAGQVVNGDDPSCAP